MCQVHEDKCTGARASGEGRNTRPLSLRGEAYNAKSLGGRRGEEEGGREEEGGGGRRREEEGGGGRRRRRRAAKKKQNHHRGEEKHNQIRGMFGDGMANGEQGDGQAIAIFRTHQNALNTTHEQFRSQWRVAA